MPAPRVKICGITRLADAELAVEHGAWAIGLNFWAGTRRRIEVDEAARITAALKRRVELVGLFVNHTLDEVTLLADELRLTMLQLHGDEGPAYANEAARRTGCKVIKAARVRGRADIQALAAFHTDFHLLDAHVEGMRGGTGETFDWELIRQRRSKVPLILSGGLTPDNVGAGIEATRPFAVDVASGVEAQPGMKDPKRLAAFFDSVRATAAEGVA